MQINHPGRQTYADLGQGAVAPSAVPVDLGKYSNLLAQPRALTPDEIAAIVERFAVTASRAEEAGFDGVQIHAAHGYLLSQFLSPLVNRRDDAWGGSRENRARMLFGVIKAVRARVSPSFVVSVKLNSADFQKGGFDADDARWVVEQMNGMGVDLVELSGGSYESPAMQGPSQVDTAPKTSTAAREAYFVDFARDIAKVAKMPIMVTGGVCRREVALAALSPEGALPGVPVIGIARALAFAPDLPNAWRKPEGLDVTLPEVTWKNRAMAGLAVMALTKAQLNRLAAGKSPTPKLSPLLTLIGQRIKQRAQTKRYRAWRLSNP
jgi:2,4-dienoyl-CoA reductase-like NADH-dependent reductase (Old Yellow Enzyme family)